MLTEGDNRTTCTRRNHQTENKGNILETRKRVLNVVDHLGKDI